MPKPTILKQYHITSSNALSLRTLSFIRTYKGTKNIGFANAFTTHKKPAPSSDAGHTIYAKPIISHRIYHHIDCFSCLQHKHRVSGHECCQNTSDQPCGSPSRDKPFRSSHGSCENHRYPLQGYHQSKELHHHQILQRTSTLQFQEQTPNLRIHIRNDCLTLLL